MSNYTLSTDFTAKDSLISGNPAKLVKGSEISTEFNSVATAIASKVDKTSATGSAQIPAGTQAQRDGSPAAGYVRFNSSSGAFEGFDGTQWGPLGSNNGPVADVLTYTATAAQTVFTLTTAYTPGQRQVEVFVNGLLMSLTTDYVETDYQTITFNSGLTAGDEVVFRVWRVDTLVDGDAANMSYLPAGTSAVATTVQAKLRESVSVLDFGADPTGAASSVTAFNAALLLGGTVFVPSGTYTLDGKVSLLTDDTTLWLAANVTLNVSGVAALQDPFGAQILVSANNCAIIGSGPSSLIQNVLGTRANTVTLIPGYVKFLMRDLTLDGGKSLVTSEATDTFESGIMLLGYTPNTPSDIEATIDNVTVKNYAQYGISMYGNQCNGVKIVNCNIRDIGITGQALSVGAGIVAAIAGSNLTIANNVIKNCKQHGVFVSSAGVNSGNHTITGNTVLTCGASGIGYFEQADYGSISGVGISKIAITGNTCIENTRSGIQFNVDTVGLLKQIVITGNNCCNNTYGGIEVNCTNTSPNIVSDVVISGNITNGNGTVQVSAGANVQTVEGVTRSFTPAIAGSTSAGVGTYNAQLGTYSKIGQLVTFQAVIDWSAHTGTGDMRITGLPYASAATEPVSVIWVWGNGITVTGQLQISIPAGQTYGNFGAINNGSYSAVAIDTAGTLRITGSYFTS